MDAGKLVFAQIPDFLPRHDFDVTYACGGMTPTVGSAASRARTDSSQMSMMGPQLKCIKRNLHVKSFRNRSRGAIAVRVCKGL